MLKNKKLKSVGAPGIISNNADAALLVLLLTINSKTGVFMYSLAVQ
jgi:hypothetical protein